MSSFNIYLFVGLIGLILIGTALVAERYFREIHAACKALNSLGSQEIETGCGPIEYARVGEGYPVLVMHGTMGGFDQGLFVAKPIVEAGFQVIAVSRFGYLRSPLPARADVNQQADAYACLLNELGIQQAAVFTFSGGATSSIRFAARHPERISALILLAPAAPGDLKVPSPPRAIFQPLMRSDFFFWEMITNHRPFGYQMLGVPKGFPLTAEYKADLNVSLATMLPVSGRIDGFLFDNYDPRFGDDFRESITDKSPYPLSEIKTPMLVIGTEDDPYSNIKNVRNLAGKFPNVSLFVVPDGGNPQLGHGQEVDREMTQFLNSVVALADRRQVSL